MNQTHSSACLNCGKPLEPGDNFCAACGQKAGPSKVKMRTFFSQFFEDYFTFDSKLFRSIGPLIFKPGHLTKEYLEGKRASYIPPFRIFIFVSIFFFILLTWRVKNLPPEAGSGFNISHSELALGMPEQVEDDISRMGIDNYVDSIRPGRKGFDRLMIKQGVKVYSADQGSMRALVVNYASKLIFLMLPVFAFLHYLIYLRRKHLYSEHFTFALHLHSFIFLYLMATILFIQISGRTIPVPFNILVILVYYFFAVKKTYGQSTGKSLWKTLLGGLLYLLIFVPAFFILLTAATFFLY